MMPITRREIEILLDSPARHNYVVSAYADPTVRNGFERHMEQNLKNLSRAAGEAMAEAAARRDLDANIAVIREAVQTQSDPQAKGLAVFSSVARGLRKVVPVDFPVDNLLVIDEEPFLLPLLEHWYGDPTFLIALVDSDEAHLFEAIHGPVDRVRDLVRGDVNQEIERDKPRFSYKKRFARTQHERLFGMEDDKFLKEVAGAVRDHWANGHFTGLILLGQPHITGPLRKALPRNVESAVVGEAQHAMTTRADDLADDVDAMGAAFQSRREAELMADVRNRWKEKHRVAAGPTEVLGALQQGRAERVALGNRRDLPGARCAECDYRFGAPVGTCPYCGVATRPINAVQDIMKMAMRHRVPVHVVRRPADKDDALAPYNGVVALLLAEANWAPGRATAEASEGHAPAGRPAP
jgi:protein required for attachment to host cells